MPIVNDPIGDTLTRMRNAQHVGHTDCTMPWSRIVEQMLRILSAEGWIGTVEVIGEDPRKQVRVSFASDKPALMLTRVSKPGRRIYRSVGELRPVLNGYGVAILTTSAGLMTDADARKKGVGGEVLCTVS